MSWVSIGEAAGLAVERLADARDKRARCGRAVGPWEGTGFEERYGLEQVLKLRVSTIVLTEENSA